MLSTQQSGAAKAAPTVRRGPSPLKGKPRGPRFPHSPKTDAMLRDAYKSMTIGPAHDRMTIQQVAKQIGCTPGQATSRARALGLVRQKTPVIWEGWEREIVKRHAHMTAKSVLLRLSRAGSDKTLGQVNVFRRAEMGGVSNIRADRDYFTTGELGAVLGVDAATLGRWVRRGWLAAKPVPRESTTARKTALYLVREKDLRRFILDNPSKIPLHRVDALWFIPFLGGKEGALGGAVADTCGAGDAITEFSVGWLK